MNDFYIFFNIGMSIFMLLLGTKIYVPKFKSEKAKERFYKLKYFFIVGGIIMFIWNVFRIF